MPLPWKKAHVSRISRIVADLHAPSRGNSLVVETGFPTSLVDLFVKNRDRLKKPSKNKTGKKKKKHQQQQQQLQQEQAFEEEEEEEKEEEQRVICDPIPLSNSRDLEFLSLLGGADNQWQEDLRVQGSELLSVDCNPNVVLVVGDVDGSDASLIENGKRVLMAVLKMFVVAAMALSTKRVVVGVTMSAFLLIFLEYFGKHFLCFLKPCEKAVVLVFKPLIQRVLRVRRSNVLKPRLVNNNNCEDEDDASVSDPCDSCDLVGTPQLINSGIGEIQALESTDLDLVQGVEESRRLESDLDVDLVSGDKAKFVEVDGERIEVLIREKDGSKGGKTKRNIFKKLVPKKFRGGRKGKRNKDKGGDSSSESCSFWGEDKLPKVLEQEGKGGKQGLKDRLFGSSRRVQAKSTEIVKIEKEEEEEKGRRREKEDFDNDISISRTEKQAAAEFMAVEKQIEIERKGNSGFLFLFVIALSGLVGGQFCAVMLTVASCLMLNLVRRYRKS